MPKKILFICKKNETYSFKTKCRKSSGLFNSTRFIVDGLVERGVEANITEVVDNNSIDRAVSIVKPDIVVIEALWVVPEKFTILKKLHPKVQWYVHMHSAIPFLALEGIAMKWLYEYATFQKIGIIVNSKTAFESFKYFLPKDRLFYLQNVYRGKPLPAKRHVLRDMIHIGCFGAIRPMKNQLVQAFAALKFAKQKNAFLGFHINGSRIEMGGDPVLKNLEDLFATERKAKLVMHEWLEPHAFRELLHEIDLGMQVSMTETFSIITADYVTAGLPVVVSSEVYWVSSVCQAPIDSVDEIVETMHKVYDNRFIVKLNQTYLRWHSKQALNAWYYFVR